MLSVGQRNGQTDMVNRSVRRSGLSSCENISRGLLLPRLDAHNPAKTAEEIISICIASAAVRKSSPLENIAMRQA